jgi:hypothetical protein
MEKKRQVMNVIQLYLMMVINLWIGKFDRIFFILLELSEHDSNDSLSHIDHTNPIYANAISRIRHPPSNEFLTFDSSYT